MHSEIFYLAADNGLRGGIAPLAVGIVVVALLIGAVAYGRKRREREPAPPQEPQERAGSWQTPDEQSGPMPADHGPGHDGERDSLGYVKEGRATDELAPDGHRYLPHELTDPDSHSDPEQEPRKWNEGGSGGFGSGGGGHT